MTAAAGLWAHTKIMPFRVGEVERMLGNERIKKRPAIRKEGLVRRPQDTASQSPSTLAVMADAADPPFGPTSRTLTAWPTRAQRSALTAAKIGFWPQGRQTAGSLLGAGGAGKSLLLRLPSTLRGRDETQFTNRYSRCARTKRGSQPS